MGLSPLRSYASWREGEMTIDQWRCSTKVTETNRTTILFQWLNRTCHTHFNEHVSWFTRRFANRRKAIADKWSNPRPMVTVSVCLCELTDRHILYPNNATNRWKLRRLLITICLRKQLEKWAFELDAIATTGAVKECVGRHRDHLNRFGNSLDFEGSRGSGDLA